MKRELLDVFKGLVEGRNPWPLYLWGEAGAGKSRAALALCDHVPESYFCVLEDVCDRIMSREAYWLWRNLPQRNLLVVDELATRSKASDLEYTAIKKLSDTREDEAAIYISNVAPGDLNAIYDNRIASRVLCGTVFHLEDRDRRAATTERE